MGRSTPWSAWRARRKGHGGGEGLDEPRVLLKWVALFSGRTMGGTRGERPFRDTRLQAFQGVWQIGRIDPINRTRRSSQTLGKRVFQGSIGAIRLLWTMAQRLLWSTTVTTDERRPVMQKPMFTSSISTRRFWTLLPRRQGHAFRRRRSGRPPRMDSAEEENNPSLGRTGRSASRSARAI